MTSLFYTMTTLFDSEAFLSDLLARETSRLFAWSSIVSRDCHEHEPAVGTDAAPVKGGVASPLIKRSAILRINPAYLPFTPLVPFTIDVIGRLSAASTNSQNLATDASLRPEMLMRPFGTM